MRRTLLPIALVLIGAIGLRWLDRSAAASGVGDPIGPVQASLTDGQAFALAQPPNEVVVVNFWATWCAPCRHEVPVLNRAHGRGVHVVGIAVDPLTLDGLKEQAADFGIQYPVGLEASGLSERLNVQVLPTTFVVARDGRIARKLTGGLSDADLSTSISAANTP